MATETPEGNPPITGYLYHVIVAYGPAVGSEYATADEVAAHLREVYTKVAADGPAGTRVFVIAGLRLPIVGEAGRQLTLPDGSTLTIIGEKSTSDDFLLRPADRAVLGGPGGN